MYGDPSLPPDFVSLPYANPDAPKGGRIVFGERGGFDSLNPHILKGNAPWAVRAHVFESFLAYNRDEAFTLYGLLAESVETGPNREWVEFTLRPEAQFSDGSPVTIEDVMWSYETLGTEGHPRYHTAWSQVESMERTGERGVRFTFNTEDKELALIMGLRPILKKAQWEDREFGDSSMEPPIGSSPYPIAEFDAGRSLTLRRNPDYWGADLPFNQGLNNFDEMRFEFFADAGVLFEAFKAGEIGVYREANAARWADSYDFPAVQSGDVVKSEIPHERPSGINGLVMNTRRPIFKDWRVRAAMIHAFNYEFISQTQTGSADPRITSYFSNSVLGMSHDAADGRVLELLEPFAADLPQGVIEGYSLPVSDGSTRNRKNLAAAMDLLNEAGWSSEGGTLVNEAGEPFRFEVLLSQAGSLTRSAMEDQAIVNIFAQALERLGIEVRITTVDPAQYFERTNNYDFDMTYYIRSLSLSPGNEQKLYWSSEAAETPGTGNWAGVNSPAVDAMIDQLLNSDNREDFVAAAHALDRLLTAGRYVIPLWYSQVSRVAHRKDLHYPDTLPVYGDWTGFLPDVWWYED
nr:extracellular solute-binding protein [Qingshengfaniella alkalisoli]